MIAIASSADVAAQHTRDLRNAAAARHLAALARCCKPSTWARALRSIAALRTRLSTPAPAKMAACQTC